jgi:hypothetical protein
MPVDMRGAARDVHEDVLLLERRRLPEVPISGLLNRCKQEHADLKWPHTWIGTWILGSSALGWAGTNFYAFSHAIREHM